MVASAALRDDEVAHTREIAEDPVRGALSDSELVRDGAEPGVRMPSDHEEDVEVVREEVPLPARVLNT